jgi:hypothetical protein
MRRLSYYQVSEVMNIQRQVWEGTPNADVLISDCCHALANHLHLDDKQRRVFMSRCGLVQPFEVYSSPSSSPVCASTE